MPSLKNQGSNDQYWATTTGEDLMGHLEAKIDDYYTYINATGIFSIWKDCYRTYYQALFNGSCLNAAGSNDEYTTVSVNHIRNFTQHMVTLTIDSRPTFEPRATNTDLKSQSQTILAKGLLDYYMREKHLETYLSKACQYAVLFGEGFVMPYWDAHEGQVYATDPETGIEAHEGDLAFDCYMPLDVIRNPGISSQEDNIWYIVRTTVNKWDLAAKYPEIADDITGCSMKADPTRQFDTTDLISSDTDMIYMYTLIHDRTPAIPQGRQVQFIDSVLLTDTVLPYRNLNLYRMAADSVYDHPFAYTATFDLLPLQKSVNLLHSTILTNQAAFGVQNVMVPVGSNLNPVLMQGGMNFLEYNPQLGPPQALNLTATPPEVFNYLEKLESEMETLSGVNSVSRGNIPSAGMSGAALALIQSMAIQFSQPLQASYVRLLEDVGTAMINQLRDYAAVPRVALIAGKTNRGMMKEFSGQDLDQINRVMVDVGSPLARTTSGKLEIAQMLLSSKAVMTTEELLQVINTGTLEPLTEGPTHELLAIRAENESLSEKQPVPVLITDNHLLHIQEHKSILSDPAARQDAELITIVTQHLMEHYQILSDPQLAGMLTLLGQTPVPSQVAQAGQTPEATGPAPQQGDPANVMVEQMQPSMPKNPLTNERWSPDTGGLPQ